MGLALLPVPGRTPSSVLGPCLEHQGLRARVSRCSSPPATLGEGSGPTNLCRIGGPSCLLDAEVSQPHPGPRSPQRPPSCRLLPHLSWGTSPLVSPPVGLGSSGAPVRPPPASPSSEASAAHGAMGSPPFGCLLQAPHEAPRSSQISPIFSDSPLSLKGFLLTLGSAGSRLCGCSAPRGHAGTQAPSFGCHIFP